MKKYSNVRGGERLKAICTAIEASGGVVLKTGAASSAPFEVTAQFQDGRKVDLVCYAFTANKYKQKNRPTGEHRFQVKYGSEFDRPHTLFLDPKRDKITLFFGVHRDLQLFIAADPAMHSPTWFSSSVEFKEDELEIAMKTGWHGWQRQRVAGGRRRAKPEREAESDLRSEVLLAFRPEHFLAYVGLERLATGFEPGERGLLIKTLQAEIAKSPSKVVAPAVSEHLLLKQFELSASELLDLIDENLRLRTAVRGGVAEHHLERALRDVPGVSKVVRLKRDRTPDFEVTFQGRVFRIECKNVGPDCVEGLPKVDFQKSRAATRDRCTRYYLRSQFEVLAACVHPITKRWEFRFRLTSDLPLRGEVKQKRRTKRKEGYDCKDRLSEHVLVEPSWDRDLSALLTRLVDR